MRSTKRSHNGLLLGAALLLSPALALAQNAPASGPDNAALAQEVAKLRAEVAQLRSATGDNWMNDRRKEEVKSVVKEVLADATTRPSVTGDNAVVAGHNGKNFFLASADKSFLMTIGGQVQVRYIYDHRNRGAATPLAGSTTTTHSDDNLSGFNVRRAKLELGGKIATDFDYFICLAGNRDTTAIELEQAYAGYKISDSVRVFGGRYIDPILRDQIISGKSQMAVERSIVAGVFVGADNYTEGAGVNWKPCDDAKITATINDGIASGTPGGTNTGFLNGGNDFSNGAADIAVTVRGDYKVLGDWKQFDDFESWSDSPTGLVIGSGFHYEVASTGDKQTSGNTTPSGKYDNFLVATLDGNFKSGGFSLYAAGVYQAIDTTNTTTKGNLTNWGAIVQGGYFVIPDKFEPFVRYEFIGLDTQVTGRNSSLQLLTWGANYYFKRHALKLTGDVVWAFDPMTSGNLLGASPTGAGLLADSATHSDQITARAQFQLLF